MATDQERLDMLVIALRDFPESVISPIEVKRGDKDPSFTSITLRELKNALDSDSKLYLIMGSDNLVHLDKWKDIEVFSQLVESIVVVNREDDDMTEFLEDIPEILKPLAPGIRENYQHIESIECSATDIRECYASGQEPGYCLDSKVGEYIEKRNIYLRES